MDIQNNLNRALRYFVKEDLDASQVYVHYPSDKNLFQYCIVITATRKNSEIKSSASGNNLYTTFLKALCEFGENMICDSLNLNCRSGIAGGLFSQNSIKRAKAELIERDAFLYHYKNILSFKLNSSNSESDSKLFELNSIDPDFKVCFVMKQNYLIDPTSCLIFGMGSETSFKDSSEKAFSEFSTMVLNHNLYLECGFDVPSSKQSKADFHHGHSKSQENKLIFQEICKGTDQFKERKYDPKMWKVEVLKSPIRFFRYVKVHHPQLEKLEFGKPEKFNQFSKLVYHPFW
ncbi:MAG TPA: hypothetical protein VNJ08_03555 [Bacteriovoracaceae bacterium]|nr:hypothetical protein [Bacteriovoracaceae bacterium]